MSTSHEYGPQKELQEILEDLSVWCAINMINAPSIKVILPQKAIDIFSKECYAKTLKGTTETLLENTNKIIKNILIKEETISLLSEENHEVITKEN